jgi:hypothetical protein
MRSPSLWCAISISALFESPDKIGLCRHMSHVSSLILPSDYNWQHCAEFGVVALETGFVFVVAFRFFSIPLSMVVLGAGMGLDGVEDDDDAFITGYV